MKYVFLTYAYSPSFNSPQNWIERTVAYAGILQCLSKRNTIINIKQIDYEGNYDHHGVQYHFVNFYKNKAYFTWRLNHYVKNLKPDVVVVQGLHVPLQVIQLRLALGKDVKIIVHHHAEQPFKGIKKYAQKLADVCIDAYLFASQAMGAGWVKKGNLSSLKKIHEVMEVSSVFTPMEKVAAVQKTGVTGDPVFLWVGRLNENKAPLTVVKAFLQFAAVNPTVRLYMIYHTEEQLAQVQELINGSSQKNTIILVGKVPHNELQCWFNSADIIISGSYYEGSGTAVCEAMSCGCMPLVTDILSFRMITDNGRCGLLYEAGNEAALLSALIQTQQMDIAAKQKIALAYFRSNLSFEAIARKMEEVAGSLFV